MSNLDGTAGKLSTDSPRGSTKSSQQGSRVHWLLHGRDAVEKMGGRFVAEEDLKAEREYWYGLCMQEVRGLETATLERIQRLEASCTTRIDESAGRLQGEVTTRLLQQSEAERNERITAISEMRRDLGVQRDLQTQVAALRQDLVSVRASVMDVARQAPRGADIADVTAQIAQAEIQAQLSHQQVKAAEAAIADLRSEFTAERERQELQAETNKLMLSDVRSQASQAQALQDQALRNSADLSRSIQELNAAVAATQGSLKADMQQEVDALRKELEKERSSFDAHFGMLKRLEDSSQTLAVRMDETERILSVMKQDALSETTLLRGRLEAVAGERDEQISDVVALRRQLSEEQNQRAAESRILTARLEGVEQRVTAAPAVSPVPTSPLGSAEDVGVFLTRLELVERQLPAVAQVGTVAGRVEHLEEQLPALAEAAAANGRLEQVERQLPALRAALEATKEHTRDSTALVARLETVEALCLGGAGATGAGAAGLGRGGGAKPSADAAGDAVMRRNIIELQSAMDLTRGNLERLARDLADERSERYRALAEVGQLTEDVAKAAAATIEKAEKRFSEGFASGELRAPDTRSELLSETGKGSHSPDAVSTVSAGTGHGDSLDRLRRPGDDTELRGVLGVHVRSLTAELRGEIMGEVAVRVASADARVGALEARLGGELQRSTAELGARMSALEAAQLPARVASLEEQAKRSSLMLTSALEERSSRKAASSAIEAIEQDVRRALTEGLRDSETTTTGSNAASLSFQVDPGAHAASPVAPKRPSSCRSERSITSSRSHLAMGLAADAWAARSPLSASSPSSAAPGGAPLAQTAPGGSASISPAAMPGGAAFSPAMTGSAAIPASSRQGSVAAPVAGPAAEASPRAANESPLTDLTEQPATLSDGLKESLEGLVSAVHRTLHKTQRTASPNRSRALEPNDRSPGPPAAAQAAAEPRESRGSFVGGVTPSAAEPREPRGSFVGGRPLGPRGDPGESTNSMQSVRGRGSLEGPQIPRQSVGSLAYQPPVAKSDVDLVGQSWGAVSAGGAIPGSSAQPGVRAQSPGGTSTTSARTVHSQVPGSRARSPQGAMVQPRGTDAQRPGAVAASPPARAPQPVRVVGSPPMAQAGRTFQAPRHSQAGPGYGARALNS